MKIVIIYVCDYILFLCGSLSLQPEMRAPTAVEPDLSSPEAT